MSLWHWLIVLFLMPFWCIWWLPLTSWNESSSATP